MATIKRRADRSGRWEVRYRDPDGKQRHKLFARKVDAEQFLTGTEHSKLAGTYVDPALGRTTFARFVGEDYRPRSPRPWGCAGAPPGGLPVAQPDLHLRRGRPGAGRQPAAASVGGSGRPGRARRIHLPRHAAHGRKPLGRRRGLGPGGGEVGGPPLGGLHQEPVRPFVPGARQALADRLEAFITASTSTPAATVTQIRPA